MVAARIRATLTRRLSLRVLAVLVIVEPLRALARYKVRSGLSALGILIGVAAVVMVVAIGESGSARAEEQLQALGDNVIWIEAGSRTVTGVRVGSHVATTLTLADLAAIRREIPLVGRASPNIDGSVQVAFGSQNWNTHYRGVWPDYLTVKGWKIEEGDAFGVEDDEAAANICLIGRTVREKIFGSGNAVGEIIRIRSQLFRVVGVLAPKGQSGSGQDQDDTLILPYETARERLNGKGFTWLDDILCSAISREAVAPAIDQVISLLRQRHHIEPDADDDFNIRRPEEVIKAQVEASHSMSLLLTSVAAISLLVGGIGIMNMMLATVAQRTREIGLRLAVGSKRSMIRLQFLGEALVLSLLGGGLGGVVGVGGTYAIAEGLGWPVILPAYAVPVAISFSVIVGIFFGLYPAWRAARLDPIDALRHE
jgi:putative ABC transport system permease protein